MIGFDANLLVAAGFMVIGILLRGFLGFSGSMGAVPGLSLLYDPLAAVSIVLLAGIGAVLQLLRTAVRQSEKRIVAPLALASIVTTPLGAWLLINRHPQDMQRAITVTVLCFGRVLRPALPQFVANFRTVPTRETYMEEHTTTVVPKVALKIASHHKMPGANIATPNVNNFLT